MNTVQREQTIPAKPAMQAIDTIVRFSVIPGELVEVVLTTQVEDGTSSSNVYNFMREEYAELMEANPSWAPTKPANTFRVEDLFAFIDYLANKVS